MDKLDDLFRGFRSGVTAPSGDAASAAREVLLREIGSIEGPRPSRPRRPWEFVAVAAAILVGGLLVTPAFGLGSRLLDLINGKSTPGDVQTPAWSPDGRKLAFVSRRDGNSEIYVMNADGSAQENLTRQPANDSQPSWSPDGRKIAFVSRRDGNSEIYVMNADGSGKRNLTRDRATDDYPTWSPDGRRIAFLRDRQRRWYLYVVNADGSGLRRLTFGPTPTGNIPTGYIPAGRSPLVWSPDGRTISFAPYLVRADGSGSRGLPYIPLTAVWSPDGRRIAFTREGRTGPGPCCYHSPLDIYVMDADGSGTRKLTHNARFNAEPAWSPDGRKIAFRSTRNGNRDIYVMNADGSGKRNLTRNPAQDSRPSWSPDGRTIAFLREREVYIVKADGSGERRLTQLNE
jgi:Tol biopolymer transport system component